MKYLILISVFICLVGVTFSIKIDEKFGKFFKNFFQDTEKIKEKLPFDDLIEKANEKISETLKGKSKLAKIFLNPHGFDNKSIICYGCEAVVKVVKYDLDVMKYSAETIKRIIQSLCHLLAPLEIQKEMCDDITNYIDKIINWLINGTTPVGVCEKLHFCPEKESENPFHVFSRSHWEKILRKVKAKTFKDIKEKKAANKDVESESKPFVFENDVKPDSASSNDVPAVELERKR